MPRTFRATTVVLALLVVTVAACGPGSGAGSTEPSTPPSAAPSAAASTEPSVEPSLTPGASEGGGVVFIVNMTDDATLGAYLTGDEGRTLYIFTNDSPDTSTCNDACAAAWPPFTIGSSGIEAGPGVTGSLGTIERADGSTQVTYDHQPLYYYSGDTAAGDTNGQNMSNVWFVALVGGNAGAASPSPGRGDY